MKNNIIPTAGVLIIKEGKVLLVRHEEASGYINGVYGLPAGRIEKGESAQEAAIRELKEETGLEAKVENLSELPTVWRAILERKDGPKEFSVQVFAAHAFQGKLEGSQETTLEWVDIANIEDYTLSPNTKEIIEEGMKLL